MIRRPVLKRYVLVSLLLSCVSRRDKDQDQVLIDTNLQIKVKAHILCITFLKVRQCAL